MSLAYEHERWRSVYTETCRQFTAREITEIDFVIQLQCLGFSMREAQAEVALHYPDNPGRPI